MTCHSKRRQGATPLKKTGRGQVTGRSQTHLCEALEDRFLLAADLWTDQSDYAFNSNVLIGGSGFASGEIVQLQVLHAPGTVGSNDDSQNQPWQVQADASGDFTTAWLVDDPDAGNATYILSASGLDSGLTSQATFTDSTSVQSVTLNGGSSVSVAPNSSITAVVENKNTANSNWRSTGWRIATTAPGTLTIVNHANHDGSGTDTETFSITAPAAPGTYNAYFVAFTDDAGTTGASAPFILVGSVTVVANNAPVLSGMEGSPLGYTENNAATAITGGLTLSDSDSANMVGATVSITSGFASGQDVLGFINQNGITGSYNSATGIMTLAGSATKANYQAALRTVTYFNSSENPSAVTRTIRFQVNDGAAINNLSNILSRNVTVTSVNDAPVLAGVPTSMTINEEQSYTFTANAIDPDSATLTFSLSGAPVGASIDPLSGVFSWTPSEAQGPGGYTLDVVVSDGLVAVSKSVALTVSEVNVAPVLAGVPTSATIDEEQPYTFTATASDHDVPAQTLTFSLAGAPMGASIDPLSGVFSWTPSEAQGPGGYTLDVVVSDGLVAVSKSVTLTVSEVNVAPVLAGVPTSATIDEEQLYTFTATASDHDVPAQTLTFSLAGAPAGASIDSLSGVFTWTPSEAQGPGGYTFDVVVSDGLVAISKSVTLTVSEVNVAPVLAGVPTSATIDEEQLYTFTATASDHDLPAQALTFSLNNAPAGASIDPLSGTFTWTPSEAQGPGGYTFDVVVSDGLVAVSKSVALTVSEVNVAPVLAGVPTSATIDEEQPYTFTATASDHDVPAQTLTFSLAGAPMGASIDPLSGVFSWTPSEAQGPGGYTLDVVVSDGLVAVSKSVTLTVSEVNVAPVLAGVPTSATIDEEQPYSFTATASDHDLPAQTLAFSLNNAPAGASIDPVSGEFTWTPTEAQGPGGYTFDVVVSDGVAAVSKSITLTVSEVNVVPVWAGVPTSVTIDEEQLYTFTATASDHDLPAQTLTFSLAGAPVGASIDPGSGTFTWTPSEAQGPGVYTFDVVVSDGVSSVSKSVTLTVSEVNVAPVLAGVPTSAAIDEEQPYSFTATASDHDLPAQTLTFSLAGAPVGASIDPGSGTFTWTPSEAQGPGVYTFDVVVSDGVSSVSKSVTLTVSEVNVAPVLAGVPTSAAIDEEQPYSFTATASDHDLPAQTLTFSLAGAPVGASIDPGSGTFTWTPSEAQGPGVYTFDVVVSDGVSSVSKSVTLTVSEVNVAPVLAGVPTSVTIDEELLYTFTATASDHDLPGQALAFGLDGAPMGASIDPLSGVFTWTPSEAQGPNVYTFDVVVSDGVVAVSKSVTLTVSEVNVAPVLASVPSTVTINEGQLYTFTATASDHDLPAGTLTFSLVGAPAGASIHPTTGKFTWTPNDNGVYGFMVKVSDNGLPALNATKTVTITVNNVVPVAGGLSGPNVVVGGQTATYSLPFTDAGKADAHTVSINWGDGNITIGPTSETIGSGVGTASTTHVYATNGTYTITFTVIDDDLGAATTSMTVGASQSIVVLNPTVQGALNVAGNASIDVAGRVIVDSNSSAALSITGKAKLKASSVTVLGGIQKTGNAVLAGTVTTGVSVPDPLSGLVAPAAGPVLAAVNVTGNNSATINPGTYSAISVSGNGRLTMKPGVYIVAGGGFSVSGNGSLIGTGVSIVNATGAAGTAGAVNVSGNGSFNLTPPSSGPLAGIVLFQTPGNTKALSISGNAALGLEGTIYAPKAQVTVSGNGAIKTTIIADLLRLSGNAGSSMVATGSLGTTMTGAAYAGQLLTGTTTVGMDYGSTIESPEEQARLLAAVATINGTFGPYGVELVVVDSNSPNPDIQLYVSQSSPMGGVAEGVLGFTTTSGEIFIIDGWDWYTEASTDGVGMSQFDYQTVLTHELGHAVGVEHSSDADSVMFAALDPGTTQRGFKQFDLSNLVAADSEESEERGHALRASSPMAGSMADIRSGLAAPRTALPTSSDDMVANGIPAITPRNMVTLASALVVDRTQVTASESVLGAALNRLGRGHDDSQPLGNNPTRSLPGKDISSVGDAADSRGIDRKTIKAETKPRLQPSGQPVLQDNVSASDRREAASFQDRWAPSTGVVKHAFAAWGDDEVDFAWSEDDDARLLAEAQGADVAEEKPAVDMVFAGSLSALAAIGLLITPEDLRSTKVARSGDRPQRRVHPRGLPQGF